MANTIRKVDYFSMKIPNKRGHAAAILKTLHQSGVDLLAFTGFPNGSGSQIDFVPADTRAFQIAARRAQLKLRHKKSGFLVQGKDQPGAIARVLGKLAGARINVTAVDAVSAGKGRYGAILWVKQEAVARGKKALGAR